MEHVDSPENLAQDAFEAHKSELVAELTELRDNFPSDYADFRLDTITQFLTERQQALDNAGLIRLYHALHAAQHITDEEWLQWVNALVGEGALDAGIAATATLPGWLLGLAAFLPPALGARLLSYKLTQDYAERKDIVQLEATCKEHLSEIDRMEASREVKAQLRNTAHRLFAEACARNGVRIMQLQKLSTKLFTPEVASSVLAHFRTASPVRGPSSPAAPVHRSQVLERPQPPAFSAAPVSASLPINVVAQPPATGTPTQQAPAPPSPSAGSFGTSHATTVSRDAALGLRDTSSEPQQQPQHSASGHAAPTVRTHEPLVRRESTTPPAIEPAGALAQVAAGARTVQSDSAAGKSPVSSYSSVVQQQPSQPQLPSRTSAQARAESLRTSAGHAAVPPLRQEAKKEHDVTDIQQPARTPAPATAQAPSVPVRPVEPIRAGRARAPLAPLGEDQVRHDFYALVPFEPTSDEDKDFTVLLVGDHPEVGEWKPEAAVPLTRGHSPHVYHCSLVLPRHEHIEYKYILFLPNGDVVWEKANYNRRLYGKRLHFDAVSGFESGGFFDTARRLLHIGREDWRDVDVDPQLVFMLEIINQLPDVHAPETYRTLFVQGQELIAAKSAFSSQRITDLVRQVHALLAQTDPSKRVFILSILLALLIASRPGYGDVVSEELTTLLPSACATVFGAPHFYLKDDLDTFFSNLGRLIEHLHREQDLQWLVYVPLLNILFTLLGREPAYLSTLGSLRSLSHYKHSMTEARFERLLQQLQRVWLFDTRVAKPFLNLKSILLHVAGSLTLLRTLATFLVKQSTDGSRWESQFKTDLVTAILHCLQPATLEEAQQIPLLQDDGSTVPAGFDPEFQHRLHTKLYQLVADSNNVQVSGQLLNSIPSNLLSLALLDKVLLSAAGAGRLPEVVALLEPFSRAEQLREELQSDALFDRVTRAMHQSRDSPTTDVMQAVDRLLRLHVFPAGRVLELARSFLHGFPPQKALEWLCTQRAAAFDPDLELTLDKMAKEVLVPQLLEAVGLRPALKHVKKIIASSCNGPLALDVLRLLCDRGLPPLAGIDVILTQARLWRKFAQVLDQAMRRHNQMAADVLKKQSAIMAKLKASISALCASLANREIVFSLLSQISLYRKQFLSLCKVLGLPSVGADLDACLAISSDCGNKLAMLNVLLSRYCQSFDLQGSLSALGQAMQELQDAHAEMRLREVQDELQEHWVPDMARPLHVLHELRANELFLGLWNSTALMLGRPDDDKTSGPRAASVDDPAEAEEGEVDLITLNWESDDEGEQEDEDEEKKEPSAPEAITDSTPAPVPPRQLSFSSLEELRDRLVEAVLRKCLALGADIASGRITIAPLRSLLSGNDLTTLVDGLAQILIVVQEPADAGPTSPDLLLAALTPLQHGLLLHQFVSSFLDFVATLDWRLDDESDELVHWTQTVGNCLASGRLEELAGYLRAEPVDRLLARLHYNSPASQSQAIRVLADFFGVVAQGSDFILQLRSFKDKNELRAVLDLCKSNTDKESELQALANFRDAANVIHAFDDTPAPDDHGTLQWERFVDALEHLQIRPATIRLITDVNAQMVELRRVFADAYKGSSTRAIADLYNLMENGFFCFVPPGRTHTMHAKLVAPQCLFAVTPSGAAATKQPSAQGADSPHHRLEVKRSLEWLEELRNRLMLATDMGSKDLQAIESFLDMLVLLKEINESRVDLFISGHPEFQAYSVRKRVHECELRQLASEKEELAHRLERWTVAVDGLRMQYYYLNFFTIHQLLAIVPLIEQLRRDEQLPAQLLDHLKFVKLDLEHEATRVALLQFYKETAALPPEGGREDEQLLAGQLAVLGEALRFLFKGNSECQRPWIPAVKANAGDFTPGEPNVIVAAKRDAVLVRLMSLYAQLCQRLPEAEEVLICTPSTTREHIRLLLLRCLGAESAGRDSRLYCLTHIEQLSFELQSYATLLHAKLSADRQKRSENAAARYRLAVISGEAEGQEAVTAWASFMRQRLDVVPTVDIRSALEEYFKSRAMLVRSFESQFAGMGKTHIIEGWCRKEANATPHRIAIHGGTSSPELAALLAARAQRPVFHFDLAPNVGSELNTLLFALLVLGTAQQTHGQMLFWPRDSTLAVEVPNSIKNSTRQRLHFLDLLPATMLTEADNPIITAAEPATLTTTYRIGDAQVHQNRVQYVCKFLRAYGGNTLHKDDVVPHLIPDLPHDECMTLLGRYCPNWPNLTLVLRMNFVNYFFQQLRAFEDSSFFGRVELMEPQARILRHAVVQWLIDTTADFASSSMDPKQSTTYDLSKTFKLSRRWGDRRQPYLIFNTNGGGSVSPLWMEPEQAADPEHVALLRSLSCSTCNQGHSRTQHICTVPALIHFNEQLGRNLLAILFGVPVHQIEEAARATEARSEYVLTLDNFLKIVAIHFRVKARIPVVIMGETGCGKTRLIEFVCACQAVPLKKRDVHSGVSLADLYADVHDAIEMANDFSDMPVYLFFDEFNTKDAPGFFKSVVCDRRVDEEALPANLVLIAACNPYRKSVSMSTAGLVYQYVDAQASQEELKQLAYMVHPLPEIMKQFVFDFGSLTSQAEEQYIERLLARCSVSQFPATYRAFCKAVHSSHEFVKEHEKELHGTVSLRDVLRCTSLYEWFMGYLRENRGAAINEGTSSKALILALAICYYFRLTKQLRQEYIRKLGGAFRDGRFLSVLIEEAKWIIDNMDLPPGTAKNQALRENVFVLLVCIYNKIPVFLVGKPGSSKTLAMTLIRNNFGQRRKLTLPSIDITSHQCSPQSTSDGIRESYQRACRLGDAEGRVCGVLLLEEVGLAELSPHLPLKVLHSILDEARVSVVGISNWVLDPAKMNRAVHLDRPSPTVKDLEATMKQMLAAQGDSMLVRNLLKPLAEAYNEIYHDHQRIKPDFYGLRDFYALVRDLHQGLQSQPQKRGDWRQSVSNVEFEVLRRAVSHNFNGQGAEEFEKLLKIFLNKTKIVAAEDRKKAPNPLTVVKENLEASGRVRHLMLLTKNDAALQILLDFNIVQHEKTKILFGSDYANDQNSTYVCRMIQQIRMSMERGDCLILLHQDNLYESLYDLLNQNYMHVGNCKYCWIALGAHSRQCVVHENFKCIVIVDKDRALQPTGLPPPFLNRFVKLTLSPSDIINRFRAADVVDKLTKWLTACAAPSAIDQAFVGYHEGFVQSLVVATIGHLKERAEAGSKQVKIKGEQVLRKAKRWALLAATLETGMRLGDNRPDVPEAKSFFAIYRKQPHLNLDQLCAYARQHKWDADGGGLQMVVLTHSTRLHQLERALGEENVAAVKLVHLMNLTSEHELTSVLADFWTSSEDPNERYLFVTAHAPGCSDDRLSHFKFLCSRERARFVQTQRGRAPRHVVVLRFLPRLAPTPATPGGGGRQRPAGPTSEQQQRGPSVAKIDVERQFRHVYLDNVLSGSETGEPEVEQMLGRSISDILRQESVARTVLPDLIRREYRRVLNRLRFNTTSSSGHAALIKMMERVLQRKEFVAGLVEQLVSAARASEEEESGGAVAWQTKLVRENASSREGSLRAAFYQHFVASTTRQLSWLLAQIGANGNLQLLDAAMQQHHDHPQAKLWLRLLATNGLWSFDGTAGGSGSVGGLARGAGGGPVVEVEQRIKATFPFSSAVVAAVELLRHDAEATAQAREAELPDPLMATEESLLQLMTNGKLREVAALEEQLVGRYMADFVDLKVQSSGSIPREDPQLHATAKQLLEGLLHAAIKQAGLTGQVSSIHAAYWAVEGFASELLIVLNVLGRQAVAEFALEPVDDRLLPLLHQQLAIVRSLMAALQLPANDAAAPDEQVIREWATRCADVRSGIHTLLSLLATPGDDGDRKQKEGGDSVEEDGAGEEELAYVDTDEEVSRVREALAGVEHEWLLIRLVADFHQIVAAPLSMPGVSVANFNRLVHDHLPSAEALATHDALKLVVRFLRKELAVTADAPRHWRQMSRFVEEFLLNAFLPAMLSHSSDQARTFDLLGRAIVGKSDIFVSAPADETPDADNPTPRNGIELTSSARCAIIRRLLAGYDSIEQWNDSGSRRVLAAQMAIALQGEATAAEDQPLAVLYLECFEDWLEAKTRHHRAHRLKEEAANAAPRLRSESLLDRLHTTALVRVIVRRLAVELSGVVLEADAQLDPARQQQRQHVVEAANDILPAFIQLSAGSGKLPLGQPVLHLVRELAQRNGLQLAKAILCSTRAQELLPWLRGADVARLLVVGRGGGGSDRVPSVDAFELLQMEGYTDLRDTLRATLQVGETGGLNQKLTAAPQPYGLFPALYQEVAAAYAEGNTRNLAKGVEWLGRFVTQQYPATLGPRKEWAKLASCYVSNDWALARWRIGQDTPYATMASLSLLSHLAAVVGRLGERATPLHQLLFSPRAQANGFLPSMPDDPRQRIAREYMQKPGFVYLAPCNHVYRVEPCGLPMNIELCGVDGCAAQVGGTHHVPLPGHVVLMTPGNPPNTRGYPVTPRDVNELTDQTPKAYCPLVLLENATWRLRDCATAAAFWLLRFLVDGALLLSCLADFNGSSKAEALGLAGIQDINVDDENQQHYYDERLSQSWRHLSGLVAANQEDALLLVHWALDALAAAAPLNGDYSRLDTLAKRQEWERWALAAMNGVTDAALAGAKLRELKVRLHQEAGLEQKQVLEAVTETVDPDVAQGRKDGGGYRRNNQPALWRMRTAVTVDDLKQSFLADGRAVSDCPTMALLVAEEEQLRCIAALPDVLAWKATVEQHFNKRIDKQTAENRTVGQVLQELSSPELRREWGVLFERFAAGWNLVRKFIQEHDVEKELTLIEMNERVPLVYSLNTLVGDGAQGVALVKWLVKKHNDAIIRMHRALAEDDPAEEAALDAHAADEAYRAKLRRFGELPLHLLRPAHMLQPFPSHGRIEHVLQLSARQSYLYGHGKRISYDYARVEEFLFSECVHGRPLINPDPTQLRMVTFLNEAGINNLLKQIEAAVKPQRELSEGAERRIKQELATPELAQRCLRACEMCMNFLRTSGGDPRQSLVEYAQEVLLINSRDEASGLHFGFLGDRHGDAVCLAQINALWRQLHKLVYPDPFGALAAKYREKLPLKLLTKFNAYCSRLKPDSRAALANTLEAYVRDNLLDEETVKPDAGAKEYIGPLLTNNDWRTAFYMEPLGLQEMQDFSGSIDNFPNDLKIKHCFDACRAARVQAAKP